MDLYHKIKDFVLVYKVNLVIGGVLLFLIILSNFGIYYLTNDKINTMNTEKEVERVIENVEEEKEEEIIDKDYKVDIKGAIKNPGVYELKEGTRVIDVIKKAGGLNSNADTTVNNLSKYIEDEMVIVIYTKEEVSHFDQILEMSKNEEELCTDYNGVIDNDSCINLWEDETKNEDSNIEVDTKVSLNTASLELLMTLPGIGESKAESIISYREKEGPFEKIEDIMNISGIGESTFEKIKDYITV